MSLMKISDLFNFQKGNLQSSKCISGEYNFITASSVWKTHKEFTHECEALIFAAAASGSLGRTHYVNGKFISSDLCFIITPKDPENLPIDLKFYHLIFQAFKDEIVRNTKAGTSKEAIGLRAFGKYELPYFDIEKQIRTKEKFVNTQKSTLGLGKELTHQLDLVKQLRQAFLREAMQGKLVEQNPNDEPATELLAKIKAEKEQLIKDKKIKKQKPLPPITKEEIPFKIPENWTWCRLGEASNLIFDGPFGSHLKTADYTTFGVQVVRLGNLGFMNFKKEKETFVSFEKYESIKSHEVFEGDVIIGSFLADGVKCIVLPKLNYRAIAKADCFTIRLNRKLFSEKFLMFLLNSSCMFLELFDLLRGMTRLRINTTQLKTLIIPLPPLSEQKRIVAKLDELMKYCDGLEESIKNSQTQNEMLLQQVLREALEPK
ncbi:MAG: restriction endonuclease subunit S [Calditrichaeota bacterium]|nr:MAG: restriction endonuclease subunit S [Calditrichota bacterium]